MQRLGMRMLPLIMRVGGSLGCFGHISSILLFEWAGGRTVARSLSRALARSLHASLELDPADTASEP